MVAGKIHAGTDVGREAYVVIAYVVQDAIGQTSLNTIYILAALHVHFGIVGVGSDAILLQEGGNHGHGSLEHRQAVVERSLAAATRDTEMEGNGPGAFLVSSIKRGNEGSGSRTMEILASLAKLVDVEGIGIEGRTCQGILCNAEGGVDVAGLCGILCVEHKVPAFAQPGQTCGVGVGTVKVERGQTGGIAKVGDTLVGVGQITTCPCASRGNQ